jgi:hypothetical protein
MTDSKPNAQPRYKCPNCWAFLGSDPRCVKTHRGWDGAYSSHVAEWADCIKCTHPFHDAGHSVPTQPTDLRPPELGTCETTMDDGSVPHRRGNTCIRWKPCTDPASQAEPAPRKPRSVPTPGSLDELYAEPLTPQQNDLIELIAYDFPAWLISLALCGICEYVIEGLLQEHRLPLGWSMVGIVFSGGLGMLTFVGLRRMANPPVLKAGEPAPTKEQQIKALVDYRVINGFPQSLHEKQLLREQCTPEWALEVAKEVMDMTEVDCTCAVVDMAEVVVGTMCKLGYAPIKTIVAEPSKPTKLAHHCPKCGQSLPESIARQWGLANPEPYNECEEHPEGYGNSASKLSVPIQPGTSASATTQGDDLK